MRFGDRISAIVADLDGTLIRNRSMGPVPEKLRKMASRLHHAGIPLCIATGRPWETTSWLYRDLATKGLALVAGGGEIRRPRDGAVLWSGVMTLSDTQGLERLARRFGLEYLIGGEQVPGTSRGLDASAPSAYFMGVDLRQVPEIGEHVAALGLNWTQSRSWRATGADIHVTAARVDKASGVSRMLESLNVDARASIGFGDGLNDIPMFGVVGYRVAVEDGEEDLRLLADGICGPARAEGAAEFVLNWLDSMSLS